MLKQIKKGDILLLVFFLALAAGIAASPIWTARLSAGTAAGGSDGSFSFAASSGDAPRLTAQILVAGEIYGNYSLQEDQTITVDNQYGKNIIVIKDGAVSVTESDCRNQVCVQHVPISKAGEWIVCLPHRFTVEIVDNESANHAQSGDEYDAIVH